MNLRDMLNEVLGQSGFLRRSKFASSLDNDDLQMVSIANRVVSEIVNMYNWEALKKTAKITFTETGGVPDTIYRLPTDYHSIIPDSTWETSGSRKADLPTNENQWYQLKNSSLSTGGVIRMRLRNGILLPPLGGSGTPVPTKAIEVAKPTPTESVTIDYRTKCAVYVPSDGTCKERFTDDTDEWVLDDQVFILGTQAHWMQTKLMPQYKEHMINYRQKMSEAIGIDAGAQTIGGVHRQGRRDPYYPLWRT